MAVAWLNSLPLPLLAGYSNQESSKVRQNDVETGPPRFELLSVHGPAIFTATWLFTALEMRLFDGWYNHETTFGALSFDMDVKVGAGLLSHEFYFKPKTTPKSTPVGKKWRVKATLIAVAKQYDTLSDYNALKAANP